MSGVRPQRCCSRCCCLRAAPEWLSLTLGVTTFASARCGRPACPSPSASSQPCRSTSSAFPNSPQIDRVSCHRDQTWWSPRTRTHPGRLTRHTRKHTHTRTHARTYARTHARARAHTHTHTHTHTHKYSACTSPDSLSDILHTCRVRLSGRYLTNWDYRTSVNQKRQRAAAARTRQRLPASSTSASPARCPTPSSSPTLHLPLHRGLSGLLGCSAENGPRHPACLVRMREPKWGRASARTGSREAGFLPFLPFSPPRGRHCFCGILKEFPYTAA